MLIIENIQIIRAGTRIHDHKIVIEGDKIIDIIPESEPLFTDALQIIDGQQLLATAGFIDIHLHTDGDFGDEQAHFEMLQTMRYFQAQHGVTGIIPSLVPLASKNYQNLRIVSESMTHDSRFSGAKILGIHLEGPFLNPDMRGGFAAENILSPSIDLLQTWQKIANQQITRITLSPEVPGNLEIADWARAHQIEVSLGHTNATPEVFKPYFERNIYLITHFMNAMTPFHHRRPGPVGAILNEPACILEIIADGHHLAPFTVNLMMQLPHQKVLITDSTYVLYLPEGIYTYLDQNIVWDGKSQKKTDGTLVGSSLTLNQAVINTCQFAQRPIEEIIPLANEIPAKIMKLNSKGVLNKGFDADLILMDENGTIHFTMIEGHIFHNQIQATRSQNLVSHDGP